MLVALGLCVAVALGPPAQTVGSETPVDFRIAFIGDQGNGSGADAVLALIAAENADAVLHSGDFDYDDDPEDWDDRITSFLGADFPYFASVGNHDEREFYGSGGYQERLATRMHRLGIPWQGDLGVQSSFRFGGIFFVLTAPGIFGEGDGYHDLYIREQLASDDSLWSISSFHKNMSEMQVGGKNDSTGWGVYEESRRGGAIIATGHEHVYARTHLLSNTETQAVASFDNTLVLAEDDPETPADEGRSFVFVSGIAGSSIRDQDRCLPETPPYGCQGEWASIYAGNQDARPGALFGVFNYQGDPDLAYFYFKDVDGNVVDSFFVESSLGPPAPGSPPEARDDGPFVVARGDTLSRAAPGVLANDPFSLGAILESDVASGTLSLAADGSFTYTHDGSATTADSFRYRSTNGVLESGPATATIAVLPAQGATIEVPGDYESIQDAHDAAQSGDLVLVAPGTYRENLTLTKAITLGSWFATTGDPFYIDQTILDGRDRSAVIEIPAGAEEGITVVGLTLQNAEDGIAPRARFNLVRNRIRFTTDGADYEDGSGGLCSYNVFERNVDDGIDLDGAVDVVVEHNTIRDNGGDGIEIRLEPHTGSTLDYRIRRNRIHRNQEDGIQLIGYGVPTDRYFEISHNVIHDNLEVGLGMVSGGSTRETFEGASLEETIHVVGNTFVANDHGMTGGDNAVVVNNLFVGHALALKNVDGGSVAAHNLFHDNAVDASGTNLDTATSYAGDPLLDDTHALSPGSPAIDAGTAFFAWQGVDVVDLAPSEFRGGAPDLGAFEFVPEGGSLPETPHPIEPPDGAVEVALTPTLRWLGAAESHQLQIATSPDFAVGSLVEDVLLPGSVGEHAVAPELLTHGTTYFWRVRGSGAGGRGLWSSVWTFTTLEEVTAPPAAPLLVSPWHGAAGVDPEMQLAWLGVAESFDVQLASDPGFATPIVDSSSAGPTLALAGGLLARGETYHWRVRGRNVVGAGPWSAPSSFTTAPSPLALMPPSRLRVLARSATSIEIAWDGSPDARVVGYRVHREGAPAVDEPAASHVAAGLSAATAYAFEVSALDASGAESVRTGRLEVWTSPQSDGELVTQSIRVVADDDDAEETISSGGSVSLGSGALELGQDGSKLQAVGLRFRGVDVPPGARIDGARLQFTADREESSAASLVIEMDAADDAAAFARTDGDVTGRPRTLSAVDWTVPTWTHNGASGADQRTPELTTLVQEIVDRPGWSAGNAMAFVLSGSGERAAESYDGDADLAPLLELEYAVICGDDLDGDGAICEFDCDDGDASVHPGAPETCDGRDNDCDGGVDEPGAVDAPVWFSDLDGDGRGDPSRSTAACAQPPGWVSDASDCDDLDDSVHPGAWDLCDGRDNDCDAEIDEDFEAQTTRCGVGVCAGNVGATSCVDGVVADSCDPLAGSAADDTSCNRLDDDCDGGVDEDYLAPSTSCGVGACGASGALECVSGWLIDSCQPGFPAAADASCDGLDDDCDGGVDEDYLAPTTSCGVGACGETGLLECVAGALVDSCQPGAPAAVDESCDGVDDDCDGSVDEDYLAPATSCGVGACSETGLLECIGGSTVDSCEPGAPAAFDATCDGVDDDCDGLVDEDYAPQSCATGEPGACGAGATSCQGGSEVCEQVVWPAQGDACNGIDDDCDGAMDEDFVPQETTCGVGSCSATGSTSCVAGAVVDGCTAGAPAPADASCDGLDDDCDGSVDEDYPTSATSCGVGACRETGVLACLAGVEVDSCEPGDGAASDATCDGVDDDCDGLVDEDYVAPATVCGVGACGATGSLECVAGTLVDSCEPGAPAASDLGCDGVDDDCDGLVDEGYASQSCATGQPGVCGAGTTVCEGGSVVCEQTLMAAESDAICNGLDDDCDDAVDEDYVPLPTSCGLGACSAAGATACIAGAEVDGCQPGVPAASDASCDGVDEDCDGAVDEDYVPTPTSCGVGVCSESGLLECVAGVRVDSCQPGTPAPIDSACNGQDDDCDGEADEEYAPRSCGTGEPGICAAGTTRCDAGAELCEADRLPQAEICLDGLDNDCDGESDYPADADCVAVSLGLAVASEDDDAEERVSSGGAVRLKGADLYLTEDGDALQVVGVRFGGVDVPRGATILAAHLQFTSDETSAQPTHLVLEAEASDDAVPFAKDDGDVSSRPRTRAAVAWEPAPWTSGDSGPDQRTPELAALVQEVVDRPGWVPGNALVFLISGTGHRTAHAYYGTDERAPRLELEYLPPTP